MALVGLADLSFLPVSNTPRPPQLATVMNKSGAHLHVKVRLRCIVYVFRHSWRSRAATGGRPRERLRPTPRRRLAAMSAAATSCPGTGGEDGEITYVSYGGEQHLPLVMSLVDAELSEPYSIFTYRYFVYLWPQLTFLVRAHPFIRSPHPNRAVLVSLRRI